jgi:hypothetical protein
VTRTASASTKSARSRAQFGDDAVARRFQPELHLHRFDHHQLLARAHAVAGLRLDDHGPGPASAPAPDRSSLPLRSVLTTIHPDRLQLQALIAVVHQHALAVRVTAKRRETESIRTLSRPSTYSHPSTSQCARPA